MFKKISFIASLLFFLLGTNVFAYSNLGTSTPNRGEIIKQPHKEHKLSFTTKLSTPIIITAKKTAAAKNEHGTKDPATLSTKEVPSVKAYVVPGAVIVMIIGLGCYWLIYRWRHI
ncbi:hypothetical protein [Neobacillus ginsengisoli]|uniref:Type VII secretion protein EssA n=1 Tax=Neobacillus ginsengisoli TaxID=904295 RepID=A0ABT9XZA3_9BACI|nr:hypothetical protein [Neobacillus ginsengisoli]MDQ0200580.1 hypothetical protein [Neobacillus ginsengisoli]